MPRKKVDLPLYTGGYKSDSPWLSSFGCTNLYPEPITGEAGTMTTMMGLQGMAFKGGQTMYGGPGEIALIGTPGLKLITNFGTGPHRGAIVHKNNLYVVVSSSVYKYDIFGTKTLIGTLTTTTAPVSMSSNGTLGNQLTIVDGQKLWVWNDTTFTDYTASLNLPNPIKTEMIEGYTIVAFANSQEFQLSNLYDSTTWNALQFATAELAPGNLLAMIKYNRQLWLLCENDTEVWYNSGNDVPFDHIPNGLIEWGILAPNSIASSGNYGLLWLSKNKYGQGEVVQSDTSSFTAKSITPRTLLSIWRTYVKLDDAIGFCYQEHGHLFYVLTFPTANKTWCYDVTYGGWHERSYNGGKLRANSYAFFNNMHMVGDFDNGNMYQMDMDTYTDNGIPILRSLVTYHVSDKREQVRHNFIELEGESGVGALSGQGVAPVITLECSDDGGHTYTNARTAPWSQESSDYKRTVRWPMLGTSRNRVYRISMSDPIKWRLFRMILDFTEGLH